MTDKQKLQVSEDENADLRLEIIALKREIVALKTEVQGVRANQKSMVMGLQKIEAILAGTYRRK